MTQEEKAKRYDDALEKAKSMIDDLRKGEDILAVSNLESMFPELTESEDEKIRKEIVDYINRLTVSPNNIDRYNSWIAWLEKQGEQKSTNNVEQKFKVGDWIVSSVLGTAHIIGVNDSNEYQLEYIDGKQKFSSIDYVNYEYDEWTIQDAKDGDVLVANIHHWEIGGNVENSLVRVPTIFIYQKVKTDKENIHAYVSLFDNTSLDIYRKMYYKHEYGIKDIHPATKEQRDLLFQEICKAGYEWDDEKKEVKKIEEEYDGEDYGIDGLWHAQRILEKTLGSVEGYQTDDGILSHKCAITAVKKLYEQKPTEWTDEDESCLREIANHLYDSDLLMESEAEGYVTWLESLKKRMEE